MFESRRINDYEYGIGKILSKVISIITVEKLRELKKRYWDEKMLNSSLMRFLYLFREATSVKTDRTLSLTCHFILTLFAVGLSRCQIN